MDLGVLYISPALSQQILVCLCVFGIFDCLEIKKKERGKAFIYPHALLWSDLFDRSSSVRFTTKQ
jgi:hypothetical protein